jgi:hypothetical protein
MLNDTKVAAPTVIPVVSEMLPEAALTVAVPIATPVASPPAPILAIAGALEVHITDPVKSCVLPSLKVPVAANC